MPHRFQDKAHRFYYYGVISAERGLLEVEGGGKKNDKKQGLREVQEGEL